MTTKPVTGIKIKDGKVVRKIGFHSKRKAHKTARQVKAWQATQKKTGPA